MGRAGVPLMGRASVPLMGRAGVPSRAEAPTCCMSSSSQGGCQPLLPSVFAVSLLMVIP